MLQGKTDIEEGRAAFVQAQLIGEFEEEERERERERERGGSTGEENPKGKVLSECIRGALAWRAVRLVCMEGGGWEGRVTCGAGGGQHPQ